jgi:hypothetical protein
MLPELLVPIPADQEIASVTADGAYETWCLNAITERGANAVIPPARTPSSGKRSRQARSHASKYLACALWRRWSGYHRKSRVETKMHIVKPMGQRLMARGFDRQVEEC